MNIWQAKNNSYLVEISKEEFHKELNSNNDFFIYIGRPSCPDCRNFEPILFNILRDINVKIKYFNTEAPASQKQAIRDFLKTLGISSIPYILHIKESKVIKVFDCQKKIDIEKFRNAL
jgi:predicted bacteriocin transport accessory protein